MTNFDSEVENIKEINLEDFCQYNRYNKIVNQPVGCGKIKNLKTYMILKFCENHEGESICRLAEMMSLEKSKLSKIFRILEGLGLIYFTPDEDDKRVVGVFLTVLGKREIAKASNFIREIKF